MNPKAKAHCIFLIVSLVAIFSCRKTNDLEDVKLLIGKNWALTTVMVDGSLTNPDCLLDDILIFQDIASFDYFSGAILCNESENLRTPSNWLFRKLHSDIRFSYKVQINNRSTTIHEYWEIIELTEKRLVLKDDGGKEEILRTYEN